MPERLMPEDIRGSWYLLAEDGSPEEALEADGQLVAFGLDGTFTRYDIDGDTKSEHETGDYTFDGQFLILRGKNTDTYRVRVEHDWYWFLEEKKKNRRLYRGLIDEADRIRLPDEQMRELKNVPVRVHVECSFDAEEDAIFDLIYEPTDGEDSRVGCFSVDFDSNSGELWVGLTPLVEGLAPRAWVDVVRRSYLDMHRGKPDDVGLVAVELLDSGKVGRFDYG